MRTLNKASVNCRINNISMESQNHTLIGLLLCVIIPRGKGRERGCDVHRILRKRLQGRGECVVEEGVPEREL